MKINIDDVLIELYRIIASCGGDGRSYRALINRYIRELEDKREHAQENKEQGVIDE